MNMPLLDAARALLNEVHAPRGAVSVLPFEDKDGKRLVVWVDFQNVGLVNRIPDTYEGYAVKVEQMPKVTAIIH